MPPCSSLSWRRFRRSPPPKTWPRAPRPPNRSRKTGAGCCARSPPSREQRMPGGLDQIKEFFRCLHGDEPTGYLIVWTRQDKATRAFDLSSADALDQAAKCCAQQAERFDVYAAVGLQREPQQRGSRGAED